MGKTLMVQGTTSDAGKSILVAGLCRLLKRRGVRVAPFKPQNMALNSAVTCDGGEIGRAQALQAQACGLPPHTDMNPVLLKPSSDMGSQVIIHGKATESMDARVYHDYKKTAMKAVLASYQRLQQQYDCVIVEGAGSPAEVNLRENDIANMGFAEAVDCPVIIVADIDRGGVFAHLVGTLSVLSASEQQRVSGFVINRFRGDIGLLQSGLDWLEDRTEKPVWGVIPYLKNFYLDAEDAVTINSQQSESVNQLNVAILVFSRISNHTDFDSLQLHPGVDVSFVRQGEAIPSVDLIILPGSKNVRGDLDLLYQYGWDQAINRHLRYGGKLVGICGGYQMLGRVIHDPKGIESKSGSSQGLGLINMETELASEKILTKVNGTLQIDHGSSIAGYEIHCGVSTMSGSYSSFAILSDGRAEGVVGSDNAIIGTYLHGLFDTVSAANAILAWAGLTEENAVDLNEVREQQLDRLADCLEESLDPDLLGQYLVSDQ